MPPAALGAEDLLGDGIAGDASRVLELSDVALGIHVAVSAREEMFCKICRCKSSIRSLMRALKNLKLKEEHNTMKIPALLLRRY